MAILLDENDFTRVFIHGDYHFLLLRPTKDT